MNTECLWIFKIHQVDRIDPPSGPVLAASRIFDTAVVVWRPSNILSSAVAVFFFFPVKLHTALEDSMRDQTCTKNTWSLIVVCFQVAQTYSLFQRRSPFLSLRPILRHFADKRAQNTAVRVFYRRIAFRSAGAERLASRSATHSTSLVGSNTLNKKIKNLSLKIRSLEHPATSLTYIQSRAGVLEKWLPVWFGTGCCFQN